jgi:hypothetical protein
VPLRGVLNVNAGTYSGPVPYLMLPMAQLAQVCQRLDRHAIRNWVDTDGISLVGKPIDELYLLNCFSLLRDVVNAMAIAATRRSSSSSAP